jgi:hypothetical protein
LDRLWRDELAERRALTDFVSNSAEPKIAALDIGRHPEGNRSPSKKIVQTTKPRRQAPAATDPSTVTG